MTNPSDVMRLPPPGAPFNLSGRVHSISARGTGAGPGVRFVIFLHGCPLRCAHCPNGEADRGNDGRSRHGRKADRPDHSVCRLHAGIWWWGDRRRCRAAGAGGIRPRTVPPVPPHGHSHGVGYHGQRQPVRGARTAAPHRPRGARPYRVRHDGDPRSTPACHAARFANMLRQMDKPVWMRFVLVPGFNDNPAHVEALAEFAASFPDLERVDVRALSAHGRRMNGGSAARCPKSGRWNRQAQARSVRSAISSEAMGCGRIELSRLRSAFYREADHRRVSPW